MFLVSSEDILMIFISLELTSLSLYILTAFNKRNPKSAEAALKYFLFGGMSAAFTLFGLSLLYGLSGSTNLRRRSPTADHRRRSSTRCWSVAHRDDGHRLRLQGGGGAVSSLGAGRLPGRADAERGVHRFRLQGRGLLRLRPGDDASGSRARKAAGPGMPIVPGWVPVLAVMAAASMLLGNLAAIVQSSVRRLLAYSAIAHAGYMLLGVLPHGGQSLAALVYYVITYGLATLGAFGVVSIVERQTGGDRLSDFAGLSRRAPVLSFCMMIFMLSLAGIPPLAGFFGKFYLFTAALNADPSEPGPAVAGGPGHRHERRVALLLPAGAQADLCRRAGAGDRRGADADRQPGAVALLALAVVVLGCAPESACWAG